MKVCDKPFVFLVDVVNDRILPEPSERSEVVPIDDGLGASLLELCGSFSSHRKAEACAKETVVGSHVELRVNSDIGQAKPSIADDVVDLVMELSTRRLPCPA